MKPIKTVACGLVLTMGLSLSTPLWAVEAVPTATTATTVALSLEDVQKLVLSKNTSAKDLQLAIDGLEINQQAVYRAENGLTGGAGNLAYFQEKMAQAEAAGNLAEYQKWSAMYEQSVTGMGDMTSQRNTLESQKTALDNGIADLEKSQKDLKLDLQMTSSVMYTTILELEKNADLMAKNLALQIKAQDIANLRIAQGLGIDGDYQAANIDLNKTIAQMNQVNTALNNTKRSLNDLMGKELNAPLKLQPLEVDMAIRSAAPITEDTIKDVIAKDYTIFKLKRDIGDLTVEARNAEERTTKEDYGNQVDKKEAELAKAKTNVDTTLKSKSDLINQTGSALRTAQLNYTKAVKDLEIAKTKLALGMISPMTYEQEELKTLQAEINQLTAAYDHYYANKELDYYKNGIQLTSYNQVKSMI